MPVYVCGRGDDGQLGIIQSRDTPLTILPYFSNLRIVSVGVGSGHSLFLSQDGEVFAVGRGDDGRLGLNDTLWRHEPQKITYFTDHGIIVSSVACGSYHSCALANGILYTWGGSLFGKLGHGDETPCNVPKPVVFPSSVSKYIVQVACGSRHSLALTSEAEVYAWGDPSNGVLGLGNDVLPPNPSVPGVPIPFIGRPKRLESLMGHHIVSLAACGSHSLALNSKGRVYSWGCGLYGRCGHGNEEDVVSPKEILSLRYVRNDTTTNTPGTISSTVIPSSSSLSSSFPSIHTGSGGSNSSGTGTNDSIMDKIVHIAAGGFHSIVVTNSGKVYGFGGGEHGQIGTGNAVNALAPVRIPSLPPVAQVACGWSHTLFLCTDSTVYATGNADHFKIPLATKVPLVMNTLKGLPVTSIATYNEHCIVLTAPCGTNTFTIPNGIVPLTPNSLISNQQLLYTPTNLRISTNTLSTKLNSVSSSSSASSSSSSPMMSPLPPPLLRLNTFNFSSVDAQGGGGGGGGMFSPIHTSFVSNPTTNLPSSSSSSFSSSRGEASAGTHYDPTVITPGGGKMTTVLSPLSTPKLSGIKRSLSLQSSVSSASSVLSPRSTRLMLSSIHHGIQGPTANYVSDIHALINNPYSFTDITLRVRKQDPLMVHEDSIHRGNTNIVTQGSSRSFNSTGNVPPHTHLSAFSSSAAVFASGSSSSSSSTSASTVSETDDLTASVTGDDNEYEILHAHRAILAARSPTFASMFTTGMKEMQDNCITLEDISVSIALYFLHFLYTDTLPFEMETYELIELWCIADRFLVDRLYRLCMERLQRELTITNSPYLLHIAVQLHALPIKDQILTYMSEGSHFDQVIKQDAFAELDKNLILDVLGRRKS